MRMVVSAYFYLSLLNKLFVTRVRSNPFLYQILVDAKKYLANKKTHQKNYYISLLSSLHTVMLICLAVAIHPHYHNYESFSLLALQLVQLVAWVGHFLSIISNELTRMLVGTLNSLRMYTYVCIRSRFIIIYGFSLARPIYRVRFHDPWQWQKKS